uniref:type II secretion system F family protein n=1 Tax=Acetatifactor sp. TaxID=1872090 RepID=UPI0040579910
MASYGYVAIDDLGKEIKGSIDADSEEKAKKELKAKGLIILSFTEQNMLTRDLDADFSSKPTSRDLSVFCRQFVSMTRAGVPILDVLKMLIEQTENKKLKRALREIRVNVEKGETLSDSIAQQTKIFPELTVHMVAAGEASGSLDIAMERMAEQFEKSTKTQAMIKKAMTYPIMITIIAVVVAVAMLMFVVPTYAEMFEDLGTELPGITVAVMNASDFVQAWWYILIPGVIAVVLGIGAFSKTPTGKRIFGKLALKIPILKDLTVKSAASQMARTLSTLLGSGVPLVEAVDIVSNVMTNVWFKDAMVEARDQIMVGVPLSQPLETCGLFPPMVYHMVGIGEEVGNTEDMLTKLAEYYDEEVESATQSLMAVMEPLMILVVAGIVGILIGAVIAPMGTMYSALDNL